MNVFYRLAAAFLRQFFDLLYHSLAWSYDWVASFVSVGMWQQWVLSVLPFLTGSRILEIGPGPGHLQLALRRQGKWGVGLDESSAMVRLAGSRLKSMGYDPAMINGYAQFCPLPSASFHQVVATFPSEYIFDPLTLQEAYRLLLPGGELIVLPAAWITGKNPAHRLAAALFRLTGQAPAWNERWLIPFQQVGFITRAEWLTLPSAQLLIIRAIKPALI